MGVCVVISEYETNGFAVPLGVAVKEINDGDGVFEGAGLDSTGGVLATVGVPPLPPPQDARVLHPPLPDVLQLEVNMLQVLPLPPELSS